MILSSSVGFNFTVNNIHRIDSLDTRQLIKKDIVNIRLSEQIGQSDVSISYVYMPIKDIQDNLSIISRADSIAENAVSESVSVLDISFTAKNYDDIVSPNFLVTHIFTEATQTDPSKPMYYVHSVPSSINGVAVSDFAILDKTYKEVNKRLFIKDSSNRLIYTNLQGNYDTSTGESNIYYVRYKLSDSTFNDVLLNVRPIYSGADFRDLDTSGNLKENVTKYILSYDSGGGGYSLVMPKSQQYSIKYTSKNAIEIVHPKANILDRVWFIRIRNGDFTKSFGSLYRYNIPEFSDQLFNPYDPYKFALNSQADIISDGIIKLKDKNIRIAIGESLHIDIVVKDKNDNILYAMSTLSSKDGLSFSDSEGTYDVQWSNSLIHSYDEIGGFVKLNIPLNFSYKVYASYYYEEEYYDVTDINLNPVSDIAIGESKYVFYIVPGGPTNQSRTKSVYYLKVDDNGLITYCSQKGNDGNIDLATTVEGVVYYDKGADTFINRYTTYGSDTQATHYFLLGEVSITDPYKFDTLSSIDSRIRGGGTTSNYNIEENIDSHPEVKWYEDIGTWDGIPHPGNSVLLLKLPYSILSDYGGSFTHEEIQEVAYRHVAFGTYISIRYYGFVTEVLSFIPGDTIIDLTWSDLGIGFTYDVYYSTIKNSGYVKHNVLPISTTTYSIDSLVNGVKYNVYVVATKDTIEYPKSEIWSGIPFA